MAEDAVLVTIGEPPAPALDLPLDQLIPLYLADQQASAAEVVVRLRGGELRACGQVARRSSTSR